MANVKQESVSLYPKQIEILEHYKKMGTPKSFVMRKALDLFGKDGMSKIYQKEKDTTQETQQD